MSNPIFLPHVFNNMPSPASLLCWRCSGAYAVSNHDYVVPKLLDARFCSLDSTNALAANELTDRSVEDAAHNVDVNWVVVMLVLYGRWKFY
jgi:hypothetical protein